MAGEIADELCSSVDRAVLSEGAASPRDNQIHVINENELSPREAYGNLNSSMQDGVVGRPRRGTGGLLNRADFQTDTREIQVGAATLSQTLPSKYAYRTEQMVSSKENLVMSDKESRD